MMKKCLIAFVLVILTAGIGCKKNNQGDVPATPPPTEPPTEKKWVVTSVAGEGSNGYLDGPALSAKFFHPNDVAVAADGTIYVTDLDNRRIRKIMGGQVSTFAGSGTRGIVDDNGISAQFASPFFIALDATGNLYTSDEEDSRIRKISPASDVSTYAGSGLYGFADGNADTARFDGDVNMVADGQGNIYVADIFNYRIRKISVAGKVTTIAGNGVAGFNNGNGITAQFHQPGGIALDKEGNLYVADRGNFRIRKITPAGDVSTFAGSGIQGNADGNATVAQFSSNIHDLVVDGQDNVYITDGNRIRKISAQGIVSTIAGSTAGYDDGDGTSAKFNSPVGLGIDAQGNIYVADFNNNRIRKISFE